MVVIDNILVQTDSSSSSTVIGFYSFSTAPKFENISIPARSLFILFAYDSDNVCYVTIEVYSSAQTIRTDYDTNYYYIKSVPSGYEYNRITFQDGTTDILTIRDKDTSEVELGPNLIVYPESKITFDFNPN